MPTVITHPVVALGLAPWLPKPLRRPAVLLTGIVLTALPDLDVIGFGFGIAYGDLLGHRGLSHSLPFALLLGGLVAAAMARRDRVGFALLWLYFFLCLASHGLLDAFTDGGLGVAFFSPFSNERYFFDFRPVRVSAIGVQSFFAGRWLELLAIEFRWIWLPALALGGLGLVVGRRPTRPSATRPAAGPGPS